jgi:hypothetical protein
MITIFLIKTVQGRLLGNCSTTWTFCFSFFQVGFPFWDWVRLWYSYLPSHINGITGMDNTISQLICLDLPETRILLISAAWVYKVIFEVVKTFMHPDYDSF